MALVVDAVKVEQKADAADVVAVYLLERARRQLSAAQVVAVARGARVGAGLAEAMARNSGREGALD